MLIQAVCIIIIAFSVVIVGTLTFMRVFDPHWIVSTIFGGVFGWFVGSVAARLTFNERFGDYLFHLYMKRADPEGEHIRWSLFHNKCPDCGNIYMAKDPYTVGALREKMECFKCNSTFSVLNLDGSYVMAERIVKGVTVVNEEALKPINEQD